MQAPFWIDRPIAIGLAFMVMTGFFLFLTISWRRARWPKVLPNWLFIWGGWLISAFTTKQMSEEEIEGKKEFHMKFTTIFFAVMTGVFLAISLLCFAVGTGIIENGERPRVSISPGEMERIREELGIPRM